MPKALYLTTPLYYVNAAPHIGHSYTEVAADATARYHRLKGEDVFLLTGTDEHGQKIEQAAAAAGKTPKAFVDEVVTRFTSLWSLLGIRYDHFIRTTDAEHQLIVQQCLKQLEPSLKHTTYDGWYCTPDETFWTKDELLNVSGGAPLCPSCQRPLEAVTEEGWYLPLEAHRAWLKTFFQTHPTFVQPQSRYNEIFSLLEQPLPEYLCITRPKQRVSWGIPVPFSDRHVTYVWFDALLNYVSAVGYLARPKEFAQRWPADIHFIGKDILRHHALYWPIILHALGFPDDQMPKHIFAHGWWKIGEQKMSKSLGNIVDPYAMVQQFLKGQPFAADVYRYFLLREVPFGQDGSFSEDAIMTRLNADLANDLGNLVNRTLSMIERYRQGAIPTAPPIASLSANGARGLAERASSLGGPVTAAMDGLQFSAALEAIMSVISLANQYIELAAPWKLAKAGDDNALNETLAVLAEVIRIAAITLSPFMPAVSDAMWAQLGMPTGARSLADAARWPAIPAGQKIGEKAVLFPRPEPAKS